MWDRERSSLLFRVGQRRSIGAKIENIRSLFGKLGGEQTFCTEKSILFFGLHKNSTLCKRGGA